MNALTRAASKTVPRAAQLQTGRRMQSDFAKNWLSDPSTYPIMGIISVACIGCAGFMTYKFTQCPDVRVTSKTKGQLLRTWGN